MSSVVLTADLRHLDELVFVNYEVGQFRCVQVVIVVTWNEHAVLKIKIKGKSYAALGRDQRRSHWAAFC